ncbi:bacteriocin-like WGxF protein [Bacillus atrophaeus]|uniref:bacteriocin-like WGxF protein n=1 Tax=Bacillus atrophaeus TaxID=1452 RepID=UPI002281A966|nr:bacteriocin-like WGxF protein [Bacillus atrophaeus]MCY8806977.1 bacteriocin-like WGxF protein [Bacillus atrophaeus]MED4827372.1 bacteriocin-like WGxF protein [Bacillus atrophaeus]
MKHIRFSLLTSILLIIAGIVHRIIIRMFNISFEGLTFWSGFVGVFFVIALISSLLFNIFKVADRVET